MASGTTSQRSQQLTAPSRRAGATRAAPTSQPPAAPNNRRPPPTPLATIFLVFPYLAFNGGGLGWDVREKGGVNEAS